MELKEETIASENVFSGKVFKVHVDQVKLSDGRISRREVVDHSGGVCIAAEDKNGCLLFVRQYRYPCKKIMLELPAGKLEQGEEPLACAERELREETGAKGKHFIYLGKIYGSPGFCNEAIHLYYTKIEAVGENELDDGEFLEVESIPVEKAVKMALEGNIEDAKTVIALLRLMNVR